MSVNRAPELLTLEGATLRAIAAVMDEIIAPAEGVCAALNRIGAMRLGAAEREVIEELDTLARDIRPRLIRETGRLRRLGETLQRFERRLQRGQAL